MNAPEMNARQAKKIAVSIVGLLGLATVGGCAGAFDPPTDATSPVAPRVQALVDANREYPRWADFPRSNDPLPQPVEVAAQVGALRSGSDSLAAEAARIEWTMTDPAAFSAEVNSRIDQQQISPVTAETQAEVEAFAQRTRQRGTAPPPVDRGPPPR